jgi:hypothetical protein
MFVLIFCLRFLVWWNSPHKDSYQLSIGLINYEKRPRFEVEVTLQLAVSLSLCQGIEPILRLVTRYYFLSEGCFLKFAVLSFCGALSDERPGLSSVEVTLQSFCGALSDERPGLSSVEVTLQLTVSQPVCQGIEPTLRLVTRHYLMSEGCCLKVAVLSL